MSLLTYGRGDSRPRAHPDLDVWLARRILARMTPKAIVVASGDAISLRTAYRWQRTLVGIEEVRIGEHVATFAIRRECAPTRLTPWEWKPASVAVAKMHGIRCGKWMPLNAEPCARLSGHRSTCKSRAAVENAALAARRARAA